MQDETIEDRPLKQAISAMRSALDAAIGEELDRLLDAPSPSASEGIAREHSGWAGDPVARRTLPLRDGHEPLPQTDPRPSMPGSSPTLHPKTTTTASPGSSSGGDDSDAVERRLDALALRLEGRLRKTRDRDPHRPRSDDGSIPDSSDSGRENRT